MRILGIDPGFERLGIAILEKNKGDKKEKVLFSECFKTSAKLDFDKRLSLIGKEVKNIIKKFKPEVLSIETLFFTTNQKTVMHVAEVRGVIIYEASIKGLKIFEASPLQVKVATTGYGKASKEQVMRMVNILVETKSDRYQKELKQVATYKGIDDELDAVAVALTAFAQI